MADSMITEQITITRAIDADADGGVSIKVEWSDGAGCADLLGMIGYAEHTVVEHFFRSTETP